MCKPDEHLFSDEQTRWALFFQMSKPDEHYSSDEQGEMSTFLSDEQVKMSTLYFQMSTFYLWDEHLSTLCTKVPFFFLGKVRFCEFLRNIEWMNKKSVFLFWFVFFFAVNNRMNEWHLKFSVKKKNTKIHENSEKNNHVL